MIKAVIKISLVASFPSPEAARYSHQGSQPRHTSAGQSEKCVALPDGCRGSRSRRTKNNDPYFTIEDEEKNEGLRPHLPGDENP